MQKPLCLKKANGAGNVCKCVSGLKGSTSCGATAPPSRLTWRIRVLPFPLERLSYTGAEQLNILNSGDIVSPSRRRPPVGLALINNLNIHEGICPTPCWTHTWGNIRM